MDLALGWPHHVGVCYGVVSFIDLSRFALWVGINLHIDANRRPHAWGGNYLTTRLPPLHINVLHSLKQLLLPSRTVVIHIMKYTSVIKSYKCFSYRVSSFYFVGISCYIHVLSKTKYNAELVHIGFMFKCDT